MGNLNYTETMKKFGFAEYEAKCYLALFEKESLSVGEIESLSNVPRSNIYAVMKKLLARGLCVARPGKVKKYAASDPDLFKNEIMASLDNTKKDVDNLVSRINYLFEENKKNSDPLDFIHIYRNPVQIHRAFIEVCSRAKSEVLGFSRPPYVLTTRKQITEQQEVQRAAARRGVKSRTIRVITDKDDEKIRTPHLGNKNEEVRIIDKLPMKLLISDDNIAWYTLIDPIQKETSYTCFMVEHKDYVEGFKTMFEAYWMKAKDYHVWKNKGGSGE